MSKISVVHMTTAHIPYDNRIYFRECKSLVDRGYNITLLAQEFKGFRPFKNLKYERLPIIKNKIGRILILPILALVFALKNKYDIYHLHDPELIPVGYILSLFNRKVVYDMHENVPKQIRTKQWIPSFIRPSVSSMFSLLEKIFIKKFHIVFAEISYKDDYQWIKSHNTTVLNYPDLETILSLDVQKTESFRIGYMGGVSKHRGAITMASMVKTLLNEGRNIIFECVGPVHEECKGYLEGLVNEFGPHRIVLHGRLEAPEGFKIMARCNVGMAILMPIPNYIDSYPSKIFEYMALGIPVITSNFPLYKSIIEVTGSGVLVDPKSLDDVLVAVRYIQDNPESAALMSFNGKKAALERFSWQTQVDNLTSLYSTIS